MVSLSCSGSKAHGRSSATKTPLRHFDGQKELESLLSREKIGCEMGAFIYLSWFYVFVQFLLLIRIEREQKNEDPAVTFLGHHFHERGHSNIHSGFLLILLELRTELPGPPLHTCLHHMTSLALGLCVKTLL